jgi:hypothetical protein
LLRNADAGQTICSSNPVLVKTRDPRLVVSGLSHVVLRPKIETDFDPWLPDRRHLLDL